MNVWTKNTLISPQYRRASFHISCDTVYLIMCFLIFLCQVLHRGQGVKYNAAVLSESSAFVLTTELKNNLYFDVYT